MRRVAAALMACLFLGASAWMFLNEETVEAWLTQQVVSQSTETIHQLPLQDNESWLVVVVDFEQHTADNGWGGGRNGDYTLDCERQVLFLI